MSSDRTIERIDLDVLLKCLNVLDGLETTSITKSERPDFIITRTGKKIGVEHTRAVYQEIVRAGKLHFSTCPHLAIDVTDLKDRQGQRRSNEELLASMTNQSGSWSKEDEARLDWKNKIAACLRSKRKKLNQSGYQMFDENWLLIHEFPPLPASVKTENWAGQYLRAIFSETPGVSKDFDSVFIHSGQYLFRWHKQELNLANIALVRPFTLIETSQVA